MNNVRDFGAVGDGVTKDTIAIQKAIDAGGMVFFPPGVYLSGTLYLKSNGGLELAPGAILLGSPDIADYNDRDFCPQNSFSIEEKACGAHLIVALEIHHVTLRGGGRIDGNRKAFFDPAKCSRAEFTGIRPSQMIFFCECSDVSIENLEMTHSPYWACFLHGCEDVRLHGLKITNEPGVWNGDGLDVDCCRRVCISDCNIATSDDSLAIRAGGTKKLLRSPGVTEYVTVTNCILSSRQAAVRLGVGNGTIRHCVFSNLCIRDTNFGIVLLSTYLPAIFKSGAEGVEITDVLFDNILLDVRVPFDLSSNWIDEPLPASRKKISGITFRGIRGYGKANSIIQGNLDRNIEEIEFSDVSLTLSGGERILPEMEKWTGDNVYRRPYGFYIVNASGIRFHRFRLRWRDETDAWKSALFLSNTEEVRMDDCTFDIPKAGCESIIHQ